MNSVFNFVYILRRQFDIILQSANEEMWEGLILCVNRLLRIDDEGLTSVTLTSNDDVWSDFVCEQWPRLRVRVNGVNFHQV